MIPEGSFAELRAIREAFLTHRITRRTFTKGLSTNNEPTVTAVDATETVPGKLVAPNPEEFGFAATQQVRIQWVLKLKRRETMNVGDHAVIVAPASEGGWTRTVAITADLTGPTARVNKRLGCVDVTP